MAQPSRIEEARRRLRTARFGIGAAAAAGFALFVFAARAAHPGTSNATQVTPAVEQITGNNDDQTSDDYGFDYGSGSIGPSTGAPSVRSGGS